MGFGLVTDGSGNVYSAGEFMDTVMFDNDTLFGAYNSVRQGNIFLVKYDSTGNVLWAKQSKDLDTNNWGVGTLSIDNYKHLYLSIGGGRGRCKIAFGNDTLKLDDTASQDAASAVWRFDSNGNPLCGAIIPGGARIFNAIASDTSGKFVYIGSSAATEMIFNKDTINPFAYPVFISNWDINLFPFVARWEACDSALVYASAPQNLSHTSLVIIYPNPSKGSFSIAISGLNTQSELEIYNVMGQQVLQKKINQQVSEINLDNHSEGIYFYRVLNYSGELLGEGKLIIER